MKSYSLLANVQKNQHEITFIFLKIISSLVQTYVLIWNVKPYHQTLPHHYSSTAAIWPPPTSCKQPSLIPLFPCVPLETKIASLKKLSSL